MDFRLGDTIIGKEEHAYRYFITSYNRGFVGRVIDTCKGAYEDIKVEVLKTNNDGYIGECYWVHGEHFELQKDNSVTVRKLRGSEA